LKEKPAQLFIVARRGADVNRRRHSSYSFEFKLKDFPAIYVLLRIDRDCPSPRMNSG
jgi:hypothetical protein